VTPSTKSATGEFNDRRLERRKRTSSRNDNRSFPVKGGDANDTRTKKVQSHWSLSLRSSLCGDASHAPETLPALRNTRPQLLSSTHILYHSRPVLFVSPAPLYHDLRRPSTSISISKFHQHASPSRDPNIALCCFDAPTAPAIISCHLATLTA
jgi:hypothetical protein